MQKYQAMRTGLGYLTESEAFYIDDIRFDFETLILRLKGEIKGDLCQPVLAGQWLNYALVFKEVVGFKFLDLDMTSVCPCEGFQEVLNSSWLVSMLEDSLDGQRHFMLVSQDDLIEVICLGFDLSWQIQN